MRTVDVAVIGGGTVGSATTYFLAKAGMKVALIEKGGIAAGTSGRCDGNVMLNDTIPGYDSQLKKLSQDLFPVLAGQLDIDIGWTRKGSILVIENDVEMEAAVEYCGQMKEQGYPARILDQKEMLDDEPFLAKDIAGGMEMACDGSVNPMALAQGLAHGARKHGAVLLTGTSVQSIRLGADGNIECVVTDGGDILTSTVVNAAGIWAPEVGKMVGLDIPVMPRQGQLLVGERTFRIGKRKLQEFGYNMAKFERTDYQRNVTTEMAGYGVAFVFEPTEALNFLIGSCRWFDAVDNATVVSVLRCMAQRAIRFLPILKEVKIIRTYAGFRPYTPDHFPIISESAVPGFYIAAGHEGNGIGLAPITGQLITQLISGQETSISIDPLRFSRFEEKEKNIATA